VPSGGGTVTFPLPSGPLGSVTFSPALLGVLPPGVILQVIFDPAPLTLNETERGSLGGGNVVPLGPPIGLRVRAIDSASGQEVPIPVGLLTSTVDVLLPVLAEAPEPSQQFAWLVEVRGETGFLGYMRRDGVFDPPTNSLRYTLSLGEVGGTRFLPSMIVSSWVRNHDANVHIWSAPTLDALDFGLAGPQFTLFQVVGPQVAGRIFVLNSFTGNYGWIDAASVGPSGPS
jgi:hypothetical protein